MTTKNLSIHKRYRPAKPKNSLELAKLAAAAGLTKNAINLLLLDVINISSYTDYFLLMSGNSTRQTSAIAQNVQQVLKKSGIRILNADGIKEGRWAIIDFGDVIVQIFYQPIREFYNLESLWANALHLNIDIASLPK